MGKFPSTSPWSWAWHMIWFGQSNGIKVILLLHRILVLRSSISYCLTIRKLQNSIIRNTCNQPCPQYETWNWPVFDPQMDFFVQSVNSSTYHDKLMFNVLCLCDFVFLFIYLFFLWSKSQYTFLKQKTIVKRLRSRVVKCPMSHGYWIIEWDSNWGYLISIYTSLIILPFLPSNSITFR